MIRVESIVNHPDCWNMVAKWSDDAWSVDYPGDNAETYLEIYKSCLKNSDLPYVCIALFDDEVVGTASLVDDDELDGYSDLGPWLAAIWVLPKYRGKGIANAMVKHVEAIAESQKFENLFLYTHDQQEWYQRHNWVTVGLGKLPTHEVTVMKKRLN